MKPNIDNKDLIDSSLLEILYSTKLYQEIIDSRTFARLKKIRFLGAIDYLYKQNKRKTHTRYKHTLSVATLALKYAQLDGLETDDEKYLVCAALLHDIGHAPLSHSMEPSFKKIFNISHHVAGNNIIQGSSPLGNEVRLILDKHQVNIDKLIALLDNKSQEKYASALSGPINVDTIDGVIRVHAYLPKTEQYKQAPKALDVVEGLFDVEKHYILDLFWGLKNCVYKDIINTEINLYADKVTQSYVLENDKNISLDEFYWSETKFKKKHSLLFEQLNTIKTKNIPNKPIEYNQRLYTVDNSLEMEEKYTYKKNPSCFPPFHQYTIC